MMILQNDFRRSVFELNFYDYIRLGKNLINIYKFRAHKFIATVGSQEKSATIIGSRIQKPVKTTDLQYIILEIFS